MYRISLKAPPATIGLLRDGLGYDFLVEKAGDFALIVEPEFDDVGLKKELRSSTATTCCSPCPYCFVRFLVSSTVIADSSRDTVASRRAIAPDIVGGLMQSAKRTPCSPRRRLSPLTTKGCGPECGPDFHSLSCLRVASESHGLILYIIVPECRTPTGRISK